MTSSLPTTHAVSRALAHHRRQQGFGLDELSATVTASGHPLTAADLARIKLAERAVTVDDLTALAHALGVAPMRMLSFVDPEDPAPDEGPRATGIPADVVGAELVDWVEGRTRLDPASRVAWWQERASRLEILSTHLAEQLEAALDEVSSLGDADPKRVQALFARISAEELDAHLTQRDLDLAQARLDGLEADHR